MSSGEIVSFDMQLNVAEFNAELRKSLALLSHTFHLVERMGLPENAQQAIDMIQQITRAVNSLRLAYNALQTARMAAGDPIAWGLFAVQVGTAIYNAADIIDNLSRQGRL